jgi:hypothetical protein
MWDFRCTKWDKDKFPNISAFPVNYLSIIASVFHLSSWAGTIDPFAAAVPRDSVSSHPNNNEKFWEELIAYVPLIRHGLHIKRKN